MPEILAFDDLTPYLMLKNGNYLYKVPFRGGWAVLKVYYGSRPLWETWLKSLGNVVFEGQTSYMPKTRLRVERECLELWRKRGFRTFQVYDDVEVRAPAAQCPPGGWLLLEYVSEPKLVGYMPDERIPLEERFATWRRFLAEWSLRHDVAEREREPRLVHENGDGKHVMILPTGEFLWFDFEMVFRSRARVPEYVAHEIVQFLWNLLRHAPGELGERILAETAAHYPNKARLRLAHDVFLRHPSALHRLGRALDRLKAKSRKPTSKYNVARRLRAALPPA